tara:strand:- start:268 stop:567 length:300 start_codon:yes stop_codon:yes gene_type:complete
VVEAENLVQMHQAMEVLAEVLMAEQAPQQLAVQAMVEVIHLQKGIVEAHQLLLMLHNTMLVVVEEVQVLMERMELVMVHQLTLAEQVELAQHHQLVVHL